MTLQDYIDALRRQWIVIVALLNTVVPQLNVVSELRAVRGVTPKIYARLKPWVCVLPVSRMPAGWILPGR